MQRAALFTLLVASILFAGGLQAQRGGGGSFRGGAVVGGHIGSHFGGRPGINVFFGHHRFNNFGQFGSVFVAPYWYDEPFGYEQPVVNAPQPQVVIVQRDKSEPAAPVISPANPKVIEVPGKAASAVSKPLPPAIFVLKDGQRLETRRYMLTAKNLHVTVDRQQRTIPLSALDINATVAANRPRGVELQIPTDRSEISLGF